MKDIKFDGYDINLDTKELPRERKDLWYLKVGNELDGFVSGVHFEKDGKKRGLYVNCHKASIPIMTGKDSLTKFKLEEFPDNPIGILTKITDEKHEVCLFGLDSYGECVSRIEITLKKTFEIFSNTEDDMLIKFDIKEWELIYC